MGNILFCLVIVYLYNISDSGNLESRAFQICLHNIAFIDAWCPFSSKLQSKVLVIDFFVKKVTLNHISVGWTPSYLISEVLGLLVQEYRPRIF